MASTPSFETKTLSKFHRSRKRINNCESLEEDIESSAFYSSYQTPHPPPFLPPSFGNPQVPPVTMRPLPGMAGMPAFQSNLLNQLPVAGISVKNTSKELPHPRSNSSVIVYETRQEKLVKPPPPVTSKYIVKDTGDRSPCYMRCTLNQVMSKFV